MSGAASEPGLRISITTISTKTILTLSIARRNFRADTCVKRQVLREREKKSLHKYAIKVL